MESGLLSTERYFELLSEQGLDATTVNDVFATNESARAVFYGKLCEIEPDAPGS
jgi:hypothetical protein